MILKTNISILIVLPIVFSNCQNEKKISKDDNLCTLIVSHNECTGCEDFVIDSGEVKVVDTVLAKFRPYTHEEMVHDKGEKRDTFTEPNLDDFIISDTTLFAKLWKGVTKVNYWGDTIDYDFSKKYRIKGLVANFDTLGHTYFKIKEYTLLDSIYAKRFDLE